MGTQRSAEERAALQARARELQAEGLSAAEIGTRLEVPRGTVTSWLRPRMPRDASRLEAPATPERALAHLRCVVREVSALLGVGHDDPVEATDRSGVLNRAYELVVVALETVEAESAPPQRLLRVALGCAKVQAAAHHLTQAEATAQTRGAERAG